MQGRNYTVRPLFKKFTQHCETYEPINCCVKKLHNLCKIVHNLCKIVHKLCIFFTQLLVGSYISVLCKVLNSGLTVKTFQNEGVAKGGLRGADRDSK